MAERDRETQFFCALAIQMYESAGLPANCAAAKKSKDTTAQRNFPPSIMSGMLKFQAQTSIKSYLIVIWIQETEYILLSKSKNKIKHEELSVNTFWVVQRKKKRKKCTTIFFTLLLNLLPNLENIHSDFFFLFTTLPCFHGELTESWGTCVPLELWQNTWRCQADLTPQ